MVRKHRLQIPRSHRVTGEGLEAVVPSAGLRPLLDMIDTTMLPDASFEFAVIADTHYMLDPGDRPLEFESRRKQSRRAETALQEVASLNVELVFHMGDVVQEYPETERFRKAFSEARGQLERCGISPYHVAGNQDIGDKPDATMPCLPVTPEALAFFHKSCGNSWYSLDRGNTHFVVLNTQVLNTDLKERDEQRRWFEQDLERHQESRIYLFLHLPPFLFGPDDPDVGNYDNIGQPDRTWLLRLVEQYEIETIFAAHVHFAFYNRMGSSRFFNVPSPSFTRPGFSHLFNSAPPPEQGRDDAPKLGFFLCRVFPDRTDVHTIRTGGSLELPDYLGQGVERLATRLPKGIPSSPLGLSLLHPIAPTVEIPVAYPSIIRQRVRNDYPLLSCLEMGVTSVRFPASDLMDPVQRDRLIALRDEGVSLLPFHLWSDKASCEKLLSEHSEDIDGLEVQIPGSFWPSDLICESLSSNDGNIPLTLAPVVPGEKEAEKQHPRTRIGYPVSYLNKLKGKLPGLCPGITGVLCRISGSSVWEQLVQLSDLLPLSNIPIVDISLEISSLDDVQNSKIAAEALFASALMPDTRIYFQPLLDFDRTMDVGHGLLDTLCNPRPAFHVLRCLNTVIHSDPGMLVHLSGSCPAPGMFKLESSCKSWVLITDRDSLSCVDALITSDREKPQATKIYCLSDGTVTSNIRTDVLLQLREQSFPLLIEAEQLHKK